MLAEGVGECSESAAQAHPCSSSSGIILLLYVNVDFSQFSLLRGVDLILISNYISFPSAQKHQHHSAPLKKEVGWLCYIFGFLICGYRSFNMTKKQALPGRVT